MRVLVLGGDGMLGHELFLHLTAHEVKATLRQPLAAYAEQAPYNSGNAFPGIDVRAPGALDAVLEQFRPEAVVNAIGIVKQRPESEDAIVSLEVNSLFPHRLALASRRVGARVVHFSTDCVFSGEKGGYREEDRPDAADLYGRSKLLGELAGEGALTLRTSMIGRSLYRRSSLVDWFLEQKGRVQGYRKAVFSGLTTRELSRVVAMLLAKHPHASGLYHLSAAPIDKHELLTKLRARLGLKMDIVPVDEPRIDRSLDSTRFRRVFGYSPPSWDQMLDELAQDILKKKAA